MSLKNSRAHDIIKAVKYHYNPKGSPKGSPNMSTLDQVRCVIAAHNGVKAEFLNDADLFLVMLNDTQQHVFAQASDGWKLMGSMLDNYKMNKFFGGDVQVGHPNDGLLLMIFAYMEKLRYTLNDDIGELPHNCFTIEDYIWMASI